MKNLNILIAEDNLMNGKLISRLMEKWGVKYEIVENGLEALEKSRSSKFHIILMDIQMPIMNGMDATQQIRTDNKNVNNSAIIIALTASSLKEFQQDTGKIGFSDFISKPFQPDELKNKLLKYGKDIFNSWQSPEYKFSFDSQLDNDFLNEFYDGDYAYAAEMFELFIEHQYPEFLAIEEVIQLNKRNEAKQLMHRLAPSFSMVGLTSITKELVVFIEELKSANSKRDLSDQFNKILSESNKLLKVVKSEAQNLKKLNQRI